MAEVTREMRMGLNRGKPRVWLEGQWLHELGFVRGSAFWVSLLDGALTLTTGRADGFAKLRTVSGKDTANGRPHPIIDLSGDWLGPLGSGALTLTGSQGLIVIRKG